MRSGRSGLVDHDQELRHKALGWLQVGLLAVLVVYTLLVGMVMHEFSPRMVVFPIVILSGLVVQRTLWKRGLDVLSGHVAMSSLVLGTAIGLGINGVSAPVVLTPLILTFFSGYLLGSRMAWTYGLLSLLLVWICFLAQSAGWIRSEPAPPGVWFRVLVILDMAAVQSLIFLALGLRSAIRFQQREEKFLERTLDALALRRAELECQVRARTADLEKANQDLIDFSRAVSHDLKGPVRAVQGYLDVLQTGTTRPEHKPIVERLTSRVIQVESMLESALSRGQKSERM